jgi:hypothetical protein
MPRIKILPKYNGLENSQVTSTTTINLGAALMSNIFGTNRSSNTQGWLGVPYPLNTKTTTQKPWAGVPYANPSQTTGSTPPPTLSGPAVVQTTSTTTKSPYKSLFDSFKSGYSFGTNPLGRKLQNFDTGLNIFNAVANQIDIRKKQKEFDAKMRDSMLPDNYYAVNTKVDRGDWEQNDGIFRPDRMGFKTKGTLTNPQYASTNFVRYGGMLKAADGLLVPGDQMVNQAFLPDVNAQDAFIGAAPASVRNSAPAAVNNDNHDHSHESTSSSSKSSGVNPMASQTWNDYSQEFKGVTNLGIWGDKSHQKRKSDHNTGDALDLGVKDINQGAAIAERLIKEAKSRDVKYIIFNHHIWNPSISNEWRPYNGSNPHTGHVHISFNRSKNLSSTTQPGSQISSSHNNPLNVHYGNFASQYGAQSGADDAGGKVARFPDLQTGIRANKDLLFGPRYNTLTISQARNKWVSGNSNTPNNSTPHIVKAMGGDKRLADLTPSERDKLFKEFARWEGSQGYNTIKNMTLFKNGGQNNSNMKVRIVGLKKYQGDEEGSTVREKPFTDEQIAAASGIPRRVIVTKPVNFGINLNNARGEENPGSYNLSLGYRGMLGKEGFRNSQYNAGLTLPGIIRGKGTVGLTGQLDRNHYNIGANVAIPLAGGNLTFKGGYERQTGTPAAQGSDPSFMQSGNNQSTQNKGNFHGGVEYNRRIGGKNGANLKVSANYGAAPEQMAKGGHPQYSGQSDYGLYIGQRNLYSSMPENPFKSPSNTVTEEESTEENPHVLEAEGGGKNKVGETILRPDGQHNFIVGKRHSTGGVKLNKEQAPPGSFIYSDTGKMTIRNPKILKHFGQSEKNKGKTPAELAKQYDVNKFLAILKDPYADALQKQTAMRMVENYQIKLAELALVQEGIKGYPQGVPEVAKGIVTPEQAAQIEQKKQQQGGSQGMPMQRFGGVRRFDNGGPNDPYDPEFKKTIEWMTDYEQEGSSKGKKGYVGGGDNWGTNNSNIKSKEEAIKYYHDNYWPMVKDLPAGLRSRALQLAVNTGDPYGEMLVASGKMSVQDRIKAVREADAKGLKGIDKNKYILEKRKKENQADIDATVNTFKQDPQGYLTKLDAEQHRYYNEGLQGVNDDQRKFLSGYYKGVGNISNEFITPSNQTTTQTTQAPANTTSGTTGTGRPKDDRTTNNDPLGVKDMLVNSGSNATVRVTKAPLVGQTRANPNVPLQEQAWDGTNWIPKADYEKKFLNTTDPSKNVGTAQSPASAQPYQMPNWFNLWTKSNTVGGRTSPKGRLSTYNEKEAPKDHLYKGYQYWRDRAGRDFTGPADFQKYVFGELQKSNPEAMKYIENEWGETAAGRYDDAIFGARTTYAMQQQIPVASTTQPPVNVTPTTTEPPGPVATTTKTPGGSIPVPTTTLPPPGKKIPPKGKWTSQDARDFGNAIADYASLRKYHPSRRVVQPVLPEFIPVDWRGMAASLQSSQNAAANQIGTFQGGNAMGANLSFMQGQTGNQLGQFISQTDQYNAAGATAKDSERAGILNQFTMYNAQNVDKNWDEENVYDDRYRRAEREARKGIVKTWNQGEHNASKIFNLNQTEKYFNIDPWTQKMYFKDDAARAAWEAETRGGPQPGEDEQWASRFGTLMKDRNLAMLPEKERGDFIRGYMGNPNTSRKVQRKTDNSGNVTTTNTVTTDQDDDNNTTALTGSGRYGGSFKKGGSVSFVKAVDDWYKKLNYIADPEERQRVALAYARVMES